LINNCPHIFWIFFWLLRNIITNFTFFLHAYFFFLAILAAARYLGLMRTFYLGVPEPYWLNRLRIPMFVSHRRLRRTRGWLPALAPWALDSGGFTEVTMNGAWQTTPKEYVDATRRYVEEIGKLDFAAPQDWMCEPFALSKTGLTIKRHQELTIDNYIALRMLAPELPFIPVVQGWEPDDYSRCLDMYQARGIDLEAQPRVGVGSVCRRQRTLELLDVTDRFRGTGLKLHLFGVKRTGLQKVHQQVVSSDSMSWTLEAKYEGKLYPCDHSQSACVHVGVEKYIEMTWEIIPRPRQASFW